LLLGRDRVLDRNGQVRHDQPEPDASDDERRLDRQQRSRLACRGCDRDKARDRETGSRIDRWAYGSWALARLRLLGPALLYRVARA
jgi:hypothetical protein